jgi:hypothetical protein
VKDPPPDPFVAAEEIAGALEAEGLPYAIGGSMAYGIWGEPRATKDVDINVFVEPSRFAAALAALEKAGVQFDREGALREMADGGQFVAWDGPWRVDVYTPSIPFSWEASRTRREAACEGRRRWYLSAEAIAVFKLLYMRPKDLPDLQRLLAVQGKRLDAPYVRRWIAEMMGEDDPRVSTWDALCRQFWKDPEP